LSTDSIMAYFRLKQWLTFYASKLGSAIRDVGMLPFNSSGEKHAIAFCHILLCERGFDAGAG
jgi:hypothetical protein